MADQVIKLCINRCPTHGFNSISIDGEGSGVRLTPGKCCGRWDRVQAWDLSVRDWDELINEATEARGSAERRAR